MNVASLSTVEIEATCTVYLGHGTTFLTAFRTFRIQVLGCGEENGEDQANDDEIICNQHGIHPHPPAHDIIWICQPPAHMLTA